MVFLVVQETVLEAVLEIEKNVREVGNESEGTQKEHAN